MSSKQTVLMVGTCNPHKVEEFQALLKDLPISVVSAESLPGTVAVTESGETFEENARLKALGFARAAGRLPEAERPRWILSDDSGLCVDALSGQPGVRSARYGGPGCTSADNNQKLLRALAGVPAGRRSAVFVCALACAEPGASGPSIAHEVRGECRGEIVEVPRGGGGFGYDPLFLVPELGKTYAELSEAEKNRISHRGRAFQALADRLHRELGAVPR